MGRPLIWVLLGLTFLAVSLHDVQVSAEVGPTESECRPYIEKAIHELKTGEGVDSQEKNEASADDTGPGESEEEAAISADDGNDNENDDNDDDDNDTESKEKSDSDKTDDASKEDTQSAEVADDDNDDDDEENSKENADVDDKADEEKHDDDDDADDDNDQKSDEKEGETEELSKEQTAEDDGKTEEEHDEDDDLKSSEKNEAKSKQDDDDDESTKSQEDDDEAKSQEKEDDDDDDVKSGEDSKDDDQDKDKNDEKSKEELEKKPADVSEEEKGSKADDDDDDNDDEADKKDDQADDDDESTEKEKSDEEVADKDASKEEVDETVQSRTKRELESEPSKEDTKEDDDDDDKKESDEEEKTDSTEDQTDDDEDGSAETQPEDDLLLEGEIPENLRDRGHITELLHLDDEHEPKEKAIDRVADIILRDLKRIYENAIKPLEVLYKYRDLSNRHFGDPEIFSKPLILFMGPWSGGKSTIINYLTGNEYTVHSLRTGAEPSPAYFNILMHGDEPEVLAGTQLAADWTFSGLQKFGQGLEDRLRGLKLPNKLLEKVNIVEIPGILEVRKQVSRLFPFNDACQWFIDRADIIFLVYDPAKLDVGPETEAILDQLKGREYQTRIVLNKADQVKPEELLRVQSALIWNISPLMSSAQPPVMYTTSLWSHPYENSSPIRLLQAQERAFLRDIRSAIDKRIENKIASARRFAVRVRNHAKMVDCYLTTYYNHKTLFGNKKRVADQIIENPQNYHIYEGLSTLTNISRYDLPDPEVYRDFFRLNPLYEFKKLSETCTYFRGCPINKLDIAIAYDLPELVGKYKKLSEQALSSIDKNKSDSKSKS